MKTHSKRFGLSLATLIIACSVFFSAQIQGQGVDFRTLEQSQEPEQTRRSLLEQRHVIWEGQAEDLLADITTMDGELLWVSATSRRLHVSHGNQLSLYPGTLEKRIPGKILALDVHSMPHMKNRAMISVSYLRGRQLRTRLFDYNSADKRLNYNSQNKSLNSFHDEDMAALRPVDQFLYGQGFRTRVGWKSDIYKITTRDQSFRWESVEPFPDDARLLQTTHLFNDVFVSLDGEGDLLIHRGESVYDRVDGPYGTSTRALPSPSPREQQNRQTVRIAPAWLDNQNMVAVAKNPNLKRGLLSYIAGEEESFIELFRWNSDRQRLEKRFRIGPLTGRVLDLVVPDQNPDQLMWLRKNQDGMVRLELIDFGES